MNAAIHRTLIVDDESNIRFFLKEALEKTGFQIAEAESGEQALDLLRETCYDVAILDINLGGKVDGLRVLEAIRWRWPATVVVILTGHGSLESAMEAIQEGVDGYLLKPVTAQDIRKVVNEANLRAQKRAAIQEDSSKTVIQHGGLRLDLARHQCEVDGRCVVLTAREFKLLQTMLSNSTRIFKPCELVRVVQEYEPDNDQEAREIIKWYIHRLRKKIERDPVHPRYLLNVRGVGYKLGD